MGQEIEAVRFCAEDFAAFEARLREETKLLRSWFDDAIFSTRDRMAGYELEAWLVDAEQHPAPVNAQFLARLDDPMVVPELARFNIELNVHPQHLWGNAFSRFEDSLHSMWRRCQRVAGELDTRLVMIGILPTVQNHELSQENMSDLKRYRALNEQVLRLRGGAPLQLDINGHEHLKITHQDVMLEAATTSFQLHLKVHPRDALRAYNASIIAAAPMAGVAANSPFLFGHDLWAETRIPLFEQSVAVGGLAGASQGPLRRVTFGSGYALRSLFECFAENALHYPVMLPMNFSEGLEQMAHVRLHNGTIWRWTRPLLGYDYDGLPHLRIEHRVLPAGPTPVDMIANCAFFNGLMHSLVSSEAAPESQLSFAAARDNFYAVAQRGLDAQVSWIDGRRGTLQSLVLNQLLPMARCGLEQLEIDREDIERYLWVIKARVMSGQTGSEWQREFVRLHGHDMVALTAAYLARQDAGRPVHEWQLD